MLVSDRFRYTTYTITVRTRVLNFLVGMFFGGSFDVYSPYGELVLFASQKAFKLKEDIRLYSDKDKTQELLVISERRILDSSSGYEVEDPKAAELIGVLQQRKDWQSLARDEWLILDNAGNEIGRIKEEGLALSILRRVLMVFELNLPRRYSCRIGETVACSFKQNFNPFVKRIHVDFLEDPASFGAKKSPLDRRLGLAAALLLWRR